MSADNSDGVSFEKGAAGPSAGAPAAAGAAASGRPKQALWVVIALTVTAVTSLVASLSLYGLHSYLVTSFETANSKLKKSDRVSHTQLLHTVSQVAPSSVLRSVIFLLAILLIIRAVWKGRHWARWGVIGLWILAFVTQVFGSVVDLLYITQSGVPIVLRVPVFLSAVGFVVAVGLVGFSKPLVAWFQASRPVRMVPGGGGAPRRSLFTPRDSVRAARLGVSNSTPVGSRKVRETAARTEELFRGDANTERARAKQRMNAEAVQRGADQARARAKASKSRRSS